jgi:hypothetical protein
MNDYAFLTEPARKGTERHGLHNPWPRLHFPDAFLKHRDGIGAFFNPDEGEEYMLSSNQVCSAFTAFMAFFAFRR